MSSIARLLTATTAQSRISQTAARREFARDEAKDHFGLHEGVYCAGVHLIADFWGARRLTELVFMRRTLVQAAKAANATLLDISLHHFTPHDGISAVAVLAESHISVHTWPEREYAAFDIFMCGEARPELALEALRAALKPARIEVQKFLRGQVGPDG